MKSIKLELYWKISTNKIYEGVHWKVRADHKSDFKQAYVSKLKVLGTFDVVVLIFDFTFRISPLDASNCSYMVKMFEDCMVEAGVLPNDSPKYVKRVSMSSIKGKEDSVTITIKEVL